MTKYMDREKLENDNKKLIIIKIIQIILYRRNIRKIKLLLLIVLLEKENQNCNKNL